MFTLILTDNDTFLLLTSFSWPCICFKKLHLFDIWFLDDSLGFVVIVRLFLFFSFCCCCLKTWSSGRKHRRCDVTVWSTEAFTIFYVELKSTFNFWHGQGRENPRSTPLERSAYDLVKMPSLKVTCWKITKIYMAPQSCEILQTFV